MAGRSYRRSMLAIAVCTAMLFVVAWTAANGNSTLDRLTQWQTARRRPRPAPTARPIGEIAADLRRLRLQLRCIPPGTSRAKRDGLVAAYDGVLVEACRALEIETSLECRREPGHRAAARALAERRLSDAGLVSE